MTFYVYVLYSPAQDKYYIGQTEDLSRRMEEHLSGHFENAFTQKIKDWELFYQLTCSSRKQAVNIERHLKSKIQNLFKKSHFVSFHFSQVVGEIFRPLISRSLSRKLSGRSRQEAL